MSRVIKNIDAFLSHPVVIESFTILEVNSDIDTTDLAEELAILAQEESLSELELEKEELERLRSESRKILQETEEMVMDLLQKAREEARAIISTAQEEAELVRSQVYEEAQEIRRKTETEAYEQGLRRVQEDIESDRLAAFQQCQELLEEARQLKLQMMRSSESDMIRLVIAVAKKVIASELTTNPYFIVNVLREAIGFLDHPENITVYVNPQDLERFLAVTQTEAFFDIGSNEVNLEFRSDDRISTGGCSLESEGGSVDTRLETRINAVEQALREVSGDE